MSTYDGGPFYPHVMNSTDQDATVLYERAIDLVAKLDVYTSDAISVAHHSVLAETISDDDPDTQKLLACVLELFQTAMRQRGIPIDDEN